MTKDELFEQTVPEPNSGCWLWMRSVDKWGYGVVSTRPQTYAHRLSYQLHCGEIPKGACILHSCDQPCCVNPDHLRPGSHYENSQDRVRRGRAAGPQGEEHASAKLTEDDVRAIRADQRDALSISKQYNVGRDQISRIKRRQYWKHVA